MFGWISHSVLLVASMLLLAACGVEMPVIDEPPTDGSIAGQVVDADTDGPVDGVTVTTAPSTSIAISAGDGSFTISHVAPGTYNVMLRKDGYAADTTTVSVSAGAAATIHRALLKK